MAPKNTSERPGASPELSEKPKPEQADEDEINGDDDVEQPRNDKNENTCNERNDRLQVRNTDDHYGLPKWLAMV